MEHFSFLRRTIKQHWQNSLLKPYLALKKYPVAYGDKFPFYHLQMLFENLNGHLLFKQYNSVRVLSRIKHDYADYNIFWKGDLPYITEAFKFRRTDYWDDQLWFEGKSYRTKRVNSFVSLIYSVGKGFK